MAIRAVGEEEGSAVKAEVGLGQPGQTAEMGCVKHTSVLQRTEIMYY